MVTSKRLRHAPVNRTTALPSPAAGWASAISAMSLYGARGMSLIWVSPCLQSEEIIEEPVGDRQAEWAWSWPQARKFSRRRRMKVAIRGAIAMASVLAQNGAGNRTSWAMNLSHSAVLTPGLKKIGLAPGSAMRGAAGGQRGKADGFRASGPAAQVTIILTSSQWSRRPEADIPWRHSHPGACWSTTDDVWKTPAAFSSRATASVEE